MTKKHIAIVYEGEKTERQIVENLNKNFFSKNTELVPVSLPAGRNIYMLWKQLKKDDFTTDVIEVLRESSEAAAAALEGYVRADFMEVYLFFDYDGHNRNLNTEEQGQDVLLEMLETFCEETEFGKLYINYPMVESLRDHAFPKEEQCFRRCSIAIEDCIRYKKLVNEMKYYQDFRKLDLQKWRELAVNSLCKLNCIVNDHYAVPERKRLYQEMTQKKLYEKQKKKYVSHGHIAVINSFPLFLTEYFKTDVLGLAENSTQKES